MRVYIFFKNFLIAPIYGIFVRVDNSNTFCPSWQGRVLVGDNNTMVRDRRRGVYRMDAANTRIFNFRNVRRRDGMSGL